MFVFSLLPSTVHDLIGHVDVVLRVNAESDQSEIRFTGVGGAWAEVRFTVTCETGSAGPRTYYKIFDTEQNALGPPIRYTKNKQTVLMVVLVVIS